MDGEVRGPEEGERKPADRDGPPTTWGDLEDDIADIAEARGNVYGKDVEGMPAFWKKVTIEVREKMILHDVHYAGDGVVCLVKDRETTGVEISRKKMKDIAEEFGLAVEIRRYNDIAKRAYRGLGEMYVVTFQTKPSFRGMPGWVKVVWASCLAATAATVFYAGYVVWYGPAYAVFFPAIRDAYQAAAIFSGSFGTILVAHEAAHFLVAKKKGHTPIPPFFFPAPPPFGTLGGAVPSVHAPETKEDLFDGALAGLVVGLAASLVVSFVGLSLSADITSSQAFELSGTSGRPPMPLIFGWILAAAGRSPGTVYLHPAAVAGWCGCVITGLNIVPMATLDGGNVFRSAVKEDDVFNIAQAVTAVALIIAGYFLFIVAVFIFTRGRNPGAMDGTTELPSWKKAIAWATVTLVPLLCVPSFL